MKRTPPPNPDGNTPFETVTNTFGNLFVLPPKNLPTQYPTTKRCSVLKPHPGQKSLWLSPARFPICHSGRRSGKTEIAKRRLVMRAMDPWNEDMPFPAISDDPRYFAGAPTWQQAKNIYWRDLKALIPDWAYWPNKARGISESELTIRLVSGAEICVVGLDRPERIEGSPWDGGILDEYGNMKPDTWGEHVRPVMSDRRGWCLFIGVPEGRNHYYDLVEFAKIEEFEAADTGKAPLMAVYHWPSADILDPEEIRLAQRELDELTFRQEYGGDFLYFQGRVYYPFDRNIHCKRLVYNQDAPLIFCFDFNVAPGVAVVCQEQALPDQYIETKTEGSDVWTREQIVGTGVIGEVHIPRNSNTRMVCRKLWDNWKNHRGRILCYGDATGGSRGSAQTEGSDWDIIRQEFRGKWGGRIGYKLKDANPGERARVNAVNSRLLSTSGAIRMMVDPLSAPQTVKDFEGARLVEGGSGEIDKKRDPHLTHLCFAAGTLVETKAGFVPVEDLPPSGRIRTWDNSFVRFQNPGCRGVKETIELEMSDGTKVVCTPDHLFLTEKGWVEAKNSLGLSLFSRLLYKRGVQKWRKKGLVDLIGSFGNTITGLSRKASVFTTLMVIKLTMIFQTYIASAVLSICPSTCKILEGSGLLQSASDSPKWLMQRGNGMEASLGGIGTRNMLGGLLRIFQKENIPVSNAARFTNRKLLGEPSSAPKYARRLIAAKVAKTFSSRSATFAEEGSGPTNTSPRLNIAPENVTIKLGESRSFSRVRIAAKNFLAEPEKQNSAPENAIILIVGIKSAGEREVFCPTVRSCGCFALANGVIVGNTDALGYMVEYEFPTTPKEDRIVQIRM